MEKYGSGNEITDAVMSRGKEMKIRSLRSSESRKIILPKSAFLVK